MAFNENAFIIAGTAIAMAGVGLYLWDTRKDSIKGSISSLPGLGSGEPAVGGSRKSKRKHHKHRKTRKH